MGPLFRLLQATVDSVGTGEEIKMIITKDRVNQRRAWPKECPIRYYWATRRM